MDVERIYKIQVFVFISTVYTKIIEVMKKISAEKIIYFPFPSTI